MALRISRNYSELIDEAKLAEEAGELENAAGLYEQAIKQQPLEEFPFNRLMIIYRKLKNYKEELRVINKALGLFQDFYNKKPREIASKNSAVARISKQLLKSIGSGDKKQFYPEPIAKWQKRKELVERKIKTR